jgi:hypothetical protein
VAAQCQGKNNAGVHRCAIFSYKVVEIERNNGRSEAWESRSTNLGLFTLGKRLWLWLL